MNSQNRCTACRQDIYKFQFKSANLCPSCFYGDYYGKLLRLIDVGQYHGGHIGHPNGSFGKIYLTEHYLIFTEDKEPSKRWEIIIPLSSVNVELYRADKEEKYNIVKEIVVPYTDENGLTQQPKFGGYRSGVTEQLNEAVYSALVNAKKKNQRNVVTNTESVSNDIKSNDDPLQILKIRLAKGEITIEEYDKIRRILE